MAATDEWDEWHLTPIGWVRGTEKTDFAVTEVEPPADRVASFKYRQYASSIYSRGEITWEEVWRKNGTDLDQLLKKHGKYPSKFIEDRVMGKPMKL